MKRSRSVTERLAKRECGGLDVERWRRRAEQLGGDLVEWHWALLRRYHPLSQTIPLFGLGFCPRREATHMLAASDEDGKLTFIDTRDEDPFSVVSQKILHTNAIFDVCWATDGGTLATASGDQTCGVWDAHTLQSVCELRQHTASVRCVRFSPVDTKVVASCGRDGTVLLWDVTAPQRPVQEWRDAHVPGPAGNVTPTPSRSARKRETMRPHAGVTAVAFVAAARVLATAGAADGLLKLWDVRAPRPLQPLLAAAPLPDRRAAGIAALDVSATGSLAALRKDGLLALYDPVFPDRGGRECGPAARCSFYVKAAFTRCGRFVARGSSDGDVVVCPVEAPGAAPGPALGAADAGAMTPVRAAGSSAGDAAGGAASAGWSLRAHGREVCGVAAAEHVGDAALGTCSDDGTVCVWTGRVRRLRVD